MRLNYLLLLACFIACKSQVPINESFISEIQTYRQTQIKNLTANNSPLTAEAASRLAFFEPNEHLQLLARIDMLQPDETIQISTYSGIQKEFIEYATLTFELDDKPYKLTAHKNVKSMRMPMYKNKMFLMFMDLTTGESTYGGGRYLYIDESEITDGQIILDFNKAFNPYCAYSDGFNCPIPPQENRLDIAIHAGEKDFQKK